MTDKDKEDLRKARMALKLHDDVVSDPRFIKCNKIIGLEYQDFTIIDLDTEKVIREGEKGVNFTIYVKDLKLYRLGFDYNMCKEIL